MTSYKLFDENTESFFYNLKAKPIQNMLDFDYVSKKNKPSITAIIHPGRKGFHKAFFGEKEILIPIYNSISEAVKKHPSADTMINFASFRSAFESSKEALDSETIKNVIIVAEGLPERQTKELIAIAGLNGKTIIGPSTVGGIVGGKFRIGYAGGEINNIIKAKLYHPGSVGLVSKSGGLMNEMFNIIARTTDGINEGLAIGGDKFPGSTLLNHMLRFQENPEIKLIIAMSELGGKEEYEIIKAKQEGKLTKPIIMWVSGTSADVFPWEVQFGHAGAKAGNEEESAKTKNEALRNAGMIVPNSFKELEEKIRQEFYHLRSEPAYSKEIGRFKNQVENGSIMEEEPKIPERKPTNFTCTISSDVGEELTYNSIPISKIIEENYSLGSVIGLLWFKKKIPEYFAKFIEKSLIICADHGPAVSGAHNSIVAARADKDVISSLCSGLLTIGPRFGGAIDDACRYFKEAADNNIEPAQFVENMKKAGKLIPGIGHRVKSAKNPDKRVELLKDFAMKNFPSTKYLDYALEVEKITLQKAENLILNVDGCIGVLFLDAITSGSFTDEEINEIIEIGYANGLFALARSIGIIGHIFDQKRLKEKLYRHPVDDVLYG